MNAARIDEHPTALEWFRRKVAELGRRLAAIPPNRRPATLEDLERISEDATTPRHHDTTGEGTHP